MSEPQITKSETDRSETDDRNWQVVVNDEGQYSVWTLDRPPPEGWHPEGMTGSRPDCLAHIDEVWTDLRPLSLRRAMDGTEPS